MGGAGAKTQAVEFRTVPSWWKVGLEFDSVVDILAQDSPPIGAENGPKNIQFLGAPC